MWPLSTLIVEHYDFFFRGHEINGVSINKDLDTMRNSGSLPFTALRPVLTMVIHALDWLPSSNCSLSSHALEKACNFELNH